MAGPRLIPKIPAEQRFWTFVNKDGEGGCWLWTGAQTRHDRSGRGYGAFSAGGRCVQAHRFSWSLVNGPIPDGLCALHRCDNPSCVNPDHIFLGTRFDNMADMVAKGRCRSGGPPGERHWAAKLTEDQVRDIRQEADRGIKRIDLARRYGLTDTTVSEIVLRRTWKCVA